MNIVFLGYAIGEKDIPKYSGTSVAGNKMQLGILKELYKRDDVKLTVVTVPPVASFPRDRCIINKAEKIHLFDDLYSIGISFINIPILKQISQISSTSRVLKRVVSHDTLLISYNMYPEVGNPTVYVQKTIGCKICPIIADLPIDPFGKRCIVKMFLRKIYNDICKSNIKKSNKLVVLNKNAADKYAPRIPYMVIEGGVEENSISKPSGYNPKKKNIVYTGALTEYSGIMNLIKAINLLDDDSVTLDIYGDGPLKNTVMELSSDSERVFYYGKVSNEVAQKAQREAWLLANPRPVNDLISLMTFPSKIMEYMVSGVPVLSTKLSGLSEAFRAHLYMMGDQPEDMRDAIESVSQKSIEELSSKATDAYRFIADNKTWRNQIDRFCDFISDLIT